MAHASLTHWSLTGADGHARVKHVERAVPAVRALLPEVVLDALVQGVQLVVAAAGEKGRKALVDVKGLVWLVA